MQQDAPHRIHALELGPMANFVYLIEDQATRRAAVVDPAWDVKEIISLARERGVTITDILLTHSHHDHINGIEELLGSFDAQVHLLKPEAQFWGQYLDVPTLHHGGDRISVGDTDIKILHTPGHTPGSACYQLGNDLITGDTLFVYGCGRCDLRGGDPEQMFWTLKDMREKLPDEILIRPGHNYSIAETSTLREQVAGNPFMHFDDLKRFTQYRMHYHDKHRDDPYGPIEKGQEMP
ncbi:MAG: MBL fold metallo-hydrolase [Gammaproteobacteria bacterium]|nr:MBL fold metallo-hydrolase [Gammaproteobacteria bacterium]MBU2479359.1 MBL fold metallo-hydrolase [Gammaproteobacteria bacterium]